MLPARLPAELGISRPKRVVSYLHDEGEDDMKPWPGGGFAPAKPVAGGRAEVTLAGKGRGGNNTFLGGAVGRKKQQALVIFTWPGGSTSRTIKGNMTIRYVMEWCAAFNAECEGLGNRNASGVAPRNDASGGGKNVTPTEHDGNETTNEAHRLQDNVRVSDEAVERDPEVRRRFQAHRALMTNPHGEPPYVWKAKMGKSLEALSATREAARTRLGAKAETAAPEARASTGAAGISAELERLAELHAAGVLDDEEFRAAKARVLGTSSALGRTCSPYLDSAH
jgi:putative oligomerization/nucleic acid binding protein